MDDYVMPRVKHVPLQPPRPGTPGEGVYLGLWQEWATANPGEWLAIFDTCAKVGQRAASVAASFMVFMGCNVGRSFTGEALQLAMTDRWRERAFLAAWANENRRSRGVNHGLRTIEFMLAPKHPIAENAPFSRGVDWQLVPNVTMDDIDIVESMVCWWAGTAAEAMRNVAEPAIQAANTKLRAGIFGATPPQGDSTHD